MEALKFLLPLLPKSENSGMFVVLAAMFYAYIKHFLPHAAESALKKASPFNRTICESNYEWAMTCKKLAGPGLVILAGLLYILSQALTAIRTIIDLS
ncbi:MAG TPA: hypothetical protein VGB63_13265 [Pedobacter sp.]|jgi:hypothetical protein